MREEEARYSVMQAVKRTPALTPLLFELQRTQTPWQEALKTLQEAARNLEQSRCEQEKV